WPPASKWAPADLKSGGSHFANWWIWMECSPGGSFLMSKTIFTPVGAAERVAVPTAWPSVFLIVTTTGFPAALAEDCWAWRVPGSENNTAAAQTKSFTSVLLIIEENRDRNERRNLLLHCIAKRIGAR